MNFWDKLKLQILSFKKVGDTVDLSGFEIKEYKELACPLCYEPTEEEINSGKLYTFTRSSLCQNCESLLG